MENILIPSKSKNYANSLPPEYFLGYEIKKITPVVVHTWGTVLYYFLTLVTAGLFALIFRWNGLLMRWLRYKQVPTEQAKHLIILNEYGVEELIDIGTKQSSSSSFFFTEYRNITYFYDSNSTKWVQIRNFIESSNKEIRDAIGGMNEEAIPNIRTFFGQNSTKVKLDNPFYLFVDQVLTTFNLYQFFACVIWIFRDYQFYAGCIFFITLFSMIWTVWTMMSEQMKLNKMADLSTVKVYRKSGGVTKILSLNSQELVPGDIFEVNPNERLPCDAIMVEGQVLVDESSLTGESIPMHKTNVQNNDQKFSAEEKSNMVYGGTSCITSESIEDSDKLARAMVYQTGFNTSKGNLIRAMKFNVPSEYKFEKDANWFLLALICTSLCFIILYYILMYTTTDNPEFSVIALPSVDIMLTMVPPGLSLCLSMGVQYAQMRLSRAKITALKGRLINASGRMKVVFFDKTGTLTINQVKLDGVLIADMKANTKQCAELKHDGFTYKPQSRKADGGIGYLQKVLMHNFATNHSLVRSKAGQVLGDPLEEELLDFASAEFSLTAQTGAQSPEVKDKPNNILKTMKITRNDATTALNVVEVFSFKAELQRMSVVVEDPEDPEFLYSFIKGAPEKIVTLCNKASLPTTIEKQITDLAKQGFRVLAFAYKEIPKMDISKITRDMTEEGAIFQGLALFKNNLKDQTKPTLDQLKVHDFRTGMITGDNINTAVSVAKTCGLIDVLEEDMAICTYPVDRQQLVFTKLNEFGDEIGEFSPQLYQGTKEPTRENLKKLNERPLIGAIDATNFQRILDDNKIELSKEIDITNPAIALVAEHIRVFARMNPEQKAIIIKILKKYYKKWEYTVGYCGDGANDCIALKHADIGVSLSKNESSLSAPFISHVEDISCVVPISIIGKAALITNFDCFRYFNLYSIVQTIGLIIMYAKQTEYSVPMYLTMDVAMALNIANAIGLMKPVTHLTTKLPRFSLVYTKFISSLLINAMITGGIMLSGLYIIQTDPKYISSADIASSSLDSSQPTYESTIISLCAIQGTYHIAISFNIHGRFKERFYKSIYLMILFILYFLYTLYLLYNDYLKFMQPVNDYLMTQYNFVYFDYDLRGYVVGLLYLYSVLSIATEVILIWVFKGKISAFMDKIFCDKLCCCKKKPQPQIQQTTSNPKPKLQELKSRPVPTLPAAESDPLISSALQASHKPPQHAGNPPKQSSPLQRKRLDDDPL